MVAALQTLPLPGPVHSPWQVLFVALLPAIHKCVLFAFRHLPQQEQEELVQESLANACVAYARLAGQGRSQRAFPTALARFAVAQVRVGRRVGTALNSRDVLSPAAQRAPERSRDPDWTETPTTVENRCGNTPGPTQECSGPR
jgi:hypothetical protein